MRGMRTTLPRLILFAVCLAGSASLGAPAASATAQPLAMSSTSAAETPESLAPERAADWSAWPTALASAIVPGSVNRSTLQVRAHYAVNATVAVATGAINVTTTIAARNDSGGDIDRLELNTIAARLGGIYITVSTVDGAPVKVTKSEQTLIVPLGGILPNGAWTEVVIGYRATLRTDLAGSNWMFTRYGGTLALYRWIPWISQVTPFERPNHGDPFVTPNSPQVNVHLDLDRNMVVAAPGASLPTAPARSWSFGMVNVRELSIVLAPDFTVTRSSANGVPIRAYSRPGGVSGASLADLARQALAAEKARIAITYPWPAYTVVETKGGYGLESPSLVWIPGNTASASLRYLVFHETAHQWFYALVGNDQQRQPFADEAAADLLARSVLGTLRASRCSNDVLDRAITAYSTSCYYEKIYIQGGNVLDSIRAKMGTTRFWQAVTGYVQANRYRLAGSRQLLEALRVASPVDIMPILRARFPSLYP
jgi:hypothetical protein